MDHLLEVIQKRKSSKIDELFLSLALKVAHLHLNSQNNICHYLLKLDVHAWSIYFVKPSNALEEHCFRLIDETSVHNGPIIVAQRNIQLFRKEIEYIVEAETNFACSFWFIVPISAKR